MDGGDASDLEVDAFADQTGEDDAGSPSSPASPILGSSANSNLLRWATERFGEDLAIVAHGDEEVAKEPIQRVLRKLYKFVLVYFSGRWCPLSQEFDTIMKSAYLGMKVRAKAPIELVWVSCDVSEKAYVEHLRQLTFYAVPWVPYQLDSLARQYEVNSIPSLLVFDTKGRLVTDLGRDHIMQHQSATGVLTEDVLERWKELHKEKMEEWKLQGDNDEGEEEDEGEDPGLALMADFDFEPDSPTSPKEPLSP
eukprot:gnl/MRDRNA2_/MRDRNA2_105725_c0_seq1.p1 gnl/MRDRNA2_/MRDRNA2_105725_c0~~gnl/MRDRNA2_/MRDRNA2_105725_c0_seq1.p1  ORF type:complete len:252 (+),score=67.78 gnl/MRDRNA2_/MRDRNA2_105725_c0_seq1:106-861(+)